MKFVADLHIHSKYSRATAKNLDLEHLHMAAQAKGISVVGTGDFTHPGWYDELSNKLIPTGDGLFRLKEEIARPCNQRVPSACRRDVRFLLTTEISNIYKKNGKTRKNHNLVLVPDFDQADRIIQKLEQIGNIRSDGRPILGLDARDLLEITLLGSDDNYLIPAHIWTPWFSLLGSKSGFDTIEECFEDLSEYIFAVETGLSSDPPMNWRVSFLDRMTLVSNSDAHSPMKLGREANLFDTDRSYAGIRSALEKGTPDRFLGTIEFFPEEGKYHFDGHRKCGVTFSPEQTLAVDGQCPKCGRPLTLGVLYRVEELADRRPEAGPEQKQPFYHTVPLVEILSEIYSVGPGTKTVARARDVIFEKLGSEIEVLRELEIAELNRSGVPLLGDAIQRMRTGEIFIEPGFDGEFGKVRIFTPEERESIVGQKRLFLVPEKPVESNKIDPTGSPVPLEANTVPPPPPPTAQKGQSNSRWTEQ